MPAHAWEIARAEEEGVLIHNGWGPKKVLGEKAVTGLILVKCTSAFDSAGNFNPLYDDEITDKVAVGHIILAVGQKADLGFVKEAEHIKTVGGRIEVQAPGLATAEKGIFAGGDVVTGPDSIIGAIAQGRNAAGAMDTYLGGDGNIDEVLAAPEDEAPLTEWVIETRPRNDLRLLKPWERASGFDHVELALTDRQ
ncbi:MAG: FAD-dependent oxidoreductase, partial [Deltaproteobacteria bacterium]|nr:FAD-dependent oxidoreductase [Deltaproteobacteria bacterium]